MPLTFRDIDFTVELPDISHAPVLSHTPPCVKDRDDTTRALAEILEIDVVGTASVPHGYAVGSDRGQVEVFSASGAVRARNTERLAAYPDERRKWSEVERDETGTFTLGGDLTREVAGHGLELLRRVGLADEHAAIDVSLGQWAELAEDGTEVDSGPSRATVRLSYAAEGLALRPGARQTSTSTRTTTGAASRLPECSTCTVGPQPVERSQRRRSRTPSPGSWPKAGPASVSGRARPG